MAESEWRGRFAPDLAEIDHFRADLVHPSVMQALYKIRERPALFARLIGPGGDSTFNRIFAERTEAFSMQALAVQCADAPPAKTASTKDIITTRCSIPTPVRSHMLPHSRTRSHPAQAAPARPVSAGVGNSRPAREYQSKRESGIFIPVNLRLFTRFFQ